ncbi:MAG TPA: substrate-binding domain-containing protein [Planctomycetota bacterium]|nr:substrate-binding domain-containing protein [Planctomycetota bacterium]
MQKLALVALLLPLVAEAPLPAQEAAAKKRPKVAFVTNCVAQFWTVAKFGVEAAEQEFDVEAIVRMPANGTAEEQKRILEDLLAKGVEGIAVSPKDPENMTALLDKVAARSVLLTHDSDAPKSKRLCYIGMDNYTAGRLCGQLVREAIPNGGPVVIYIGNLDQDNARRRRQGVIDQLLGRSHDPSRFDKQDAALKGDKYEIRATFTDQFDRQKAKAAAQDALVRWRDIACMVGLFEYEVPLVLEAVQSANRLSEIEIVGFDEAEATLQGILDGHIHGTVVQNPFEYGRRSLQLLGQLLREPDPEKRKALLPKNGVIDIPARQIRKDDVAEFWADLKKKTGKK